MKPRLLTIQALGPFVGTERIDFTLLGDNPLFLINGPTGAGKSTLLDALCFALYGQTTGNERDASQMRCDYADPATLTEVVLDFTIATKAYRIRRVPQQEKPKSRGDGVTVQQPEAQLWLLDGSAEGQLLVAKSVTEATDTIRQIVGLDAAQFRQVMVLPQGKFRELLLADSKDREKIFGQLFQTHVYKQIEETLKERSASIRQQVAECDNHCQGILQSVNVSTESELQAAIAEAVLRYEQLDQERQKATEALEQSKLATASARQVAEKFAQLAAKQLDLQRLQGQGDVIRLAKEQLDQLEVARRIEPAYTRYRHVKTEMEATEAKVEKLKNTVLEAQQQWQQAHDQLGEAKVALAELPPLQETQVKLKQYQASVTNAAALQQAKQEHTRTLEGASAKHEAELAAIKALKQQLAQIQQESVKYDEALAPFNTLQVQSAQFASQLQRRKKLENLREKHKALMGRVTEASQTHQQREQQFQALEHRVKHQELQWHQGQAALLAAQLQINRACPVCGSKDHPRPATGSGEALVTELEIESARGQLEAARQQAQGALEVLQEQKRLLQSNLDEGQQYSQELAELADRPLAAVEAEFNDITAKIVRLQAVQQAQVDCHKQLTAGRERLAELEQAEPVLRDAWEQARLQLLEIVHKIEHLERDVPAEYRDSGQLEKRLKAIALEIETLHKNHDRAQQRLSECASARDSSQAQSTTLSDILVQQRHDLGLAGGQWQEALLTSCFEDTAYFQRALISDSEKQRLFDQVTEHQQQWQHLQVLIQQLEQELSEQVPPDLKALEQALSIAQQRQDEVQKHWLAVRERQGHLLATDAKLREFKAKKILLEDQYAVIGTLSDVANGFTGNKISLQRFVLSVLLDDVLIQASARLQKMSHGRYSLLRKEDRAKGNKASGLELEVDDSYTGKTRSVATLSGGESFLAALALALGLSDVVQSYAGGIQLDTLFVDEGFGSLDPESLELALRTLIDLQSSGRMIGVISHVSELKEQMALRLDVSGGRNGSHVRIMGQAITHVEEGQ